MVLVTRVVQIFISFISLNRRLRCSVEMMCRHIFIDDGRAFPTRLFSLEKEFMTFLAVHSSRTHEPVSSQLSFFFLSFTIKVPTSKIWAMTQTRKEEILDRFDIFLLYKKKKLLMVQKSLWNNIPFPSFLRHENTNSTFLFFKRKTKKMFFSFCVLS